MDEIKDIYPVEVAVEPSGKNAVPAEAKYDNEHFVFDAATGIITEYTGESYRLDVPETIDGVSVQTIGADAFNNNRNLIYLTLPEGLAAIEDGAFESAYQLSFVEFPLLPGVTWLKFDASNMPAMVVGFGFGPGAGVAVGIVIAVIHGLLMADFTGALMNIFCVTCFVLPAALMYRKKRTYPVAIVGLLLSVIAATLAAIVGNLLLTPMWLGVPLDAVIAMIIPILIPFNLVKGLINAVLTLIIYKSISNLITPKKDQVKGK